MAEPIRVLICDDHPIVREALRSRLESMPEVEIAGDADSGRAAIDRTRELQPDLVLVDLEMPDLDGISATRRIAELWPSVRILIFTAHDDPDLAALAAGAGASGYLLKSATLEVTRDAVLAVAAGEDWFPEGLPARPAGHEDLTRLRTLTPRERQILDLLAGGLRAEGVAGEIGVTRATVYTHIRNAVAKLGAETQAQAVALATRYSFIVPRS